MIDKTAPVQGYYRKMPMTKVKIKPPRALASGFLAAQGCAVFCLLFLLAAWPGPAEAAKIQYRFTDWNGPALRVFVTRPVGMAPDRPVVFVMHGVNRNALEYRDQWHDLAVAYDFLLVVPEFSQRSFPGPEAYDLGNVFEDQGTVRDKSEWSWSAIEGIFDDVRSRFGMSVDSYSLYGQSDGAQFAHRFIFYAPEARVNRIVVANAGWYMMPDFGVAFPYGLGDSAVDRSRLEQSLQLPVTILLGEEDTDTDHDKLRRTPEAMAQGPNRLARGQAFFNAARESARQLGVPFNWSLETVPWAGHDNGLMAPAAIPYLLGEH